MHGIHTQSFKNTARYTFALFLAASTLAFAQNSNGWKRVGDSAQAPTPDQAAPAPPPDTNNYPQADGQQPTNSPAPPPNYQQPSAAIPAQLTIPAGTFLTVRVNQMLSSDRNQPGDSFTASLVQPLVVNGVVVAEPGQTIAGQVVDTKKSHLGETARLGIQLTDLTLVDGQQVPVQSQLISRKGTGLNGNDAGTIVGTTALGAVIGSAIGWGTGAAIGAGAGALGGVLLTHGHASVIYPEQVLTFRLQAPVTISTANAPQAFHYVQPNEYNQPQYNYGPRPGAYAGGAPPPPPAPYPYAYAYPYYYPYYWGPSFVFYGGRGYWWGGHYYFGRGYYGRPGFRR
ncbi:MAG TPA: hypothetical protein VFB14_17470 [Bryobacteraceae bacterium]|jgi:hypothetical protein|nr:hypothetical protein [Bryobacteraceae bacterium]